MQFSFFYMDSGDYIEGVPSILNLFSCKLKFREIKISNLNLKSNSCMHDQRVLCVKALN